MHTYSVVLFIHISSLLVAAGASAVLTLVELQLRRAETLPQVARWALAAKNVSHAFPVAVAGLVGSGTYLVHSSWSFGAPWVLGGIAGLAAIIVLGDAVHARFIRSVGQAAAVGEDLRGQLDSALPRVTAVAPTLLMLGVVFVMVTKPGAAGTATALLVALALSVPLGPALFAADAGGGTRTRMPEGTRF